jgi:NADPH:quinone reductase-like Zn-dependent oxidoreductase
MLRLLCVLSALCLPLVSWGQTQTPSTTRKVVLEKSANGYHWKLTEAPVPAVGDHQVLIRVRAVSVNRGDIEALAEDRGPDRSGLLVASDAAGDVVAVGKAVTHVRPGSRIVSTYFKNWTDGPPSEQQLAKALGANADGVLADFVVLDDTTVAPAPAGLSYEEASTLPTAGLTGWMATVGRREPHKGDVVLIQGTGGVSIFAMQFAAASGARIILTSSSDDKLKRAQAIAPLDGINYKSVPEWSQRVFQLTNGHGADVVVDVGGKSTLEQSVRSLAFGGTLSIVGGLTGYDGELRAGALLGKVANVHGIFVGSRADLLRMNAFISAHHLHPVIDKSFPVEQFEAALKHMADGDFMGKIVLTLTGTPPPTITPEPRL